MVKIYHNPRCRKSREGLALVRESGKPHEVVLYLDNPLSREELRNLLKMLDISPMALVRKQEAIWKEEYKGKELDDRMIEDALLKHPKLMERPVVTFEGKAVIGRPPKKIGELLN
ncbi:arsenate reductase [Muriicola jejuensis]|uniref:Arsenate reductase (Glutaredoxin) n=1 Tax=Muriicola jejuensis TaxID=504488 RepID=A0A6P0UH29_9FLAO|nr:arsenate reductase (glutaredoxin) [Muriicola jejuensis]NER11149.1 arsenate reductase (glutaredoxin) [Muriicola jejuensis]SMP24080.1 arsenate reductase [Muriicola jejuensis]